MESKFSMAGSTIANKKQRARTVRPQEENTWKYLQPISEDVIGDLEDETETNNEKVNSRR